MKLQVTCEGRKLVNWKTLKDIQGDVKTLNPAQLDKLLNSLEINGFCDPFGVWENKETQENILLAGNQRLKALFKAEELGWEIPEELPANVVFSENIKDASKKLLSMASSFGYTNREELFAFVNEMEADIEEINKITNFNEFVGLDETDLIEKTKQEDEAGKALEEPFAFVNIPVLRENEKGFNQAIIEATKKAETDNLPIEYTPEGVIFYLLKKFLKE